MRENHAICVRVGNHARYTYALFHNSVKLCMSEFSLLTCVMIHIQTPIIPPIYMLSTLSCVTLCIVKCKTIKYIHVYQICIYNYVVFLCKLVSSELLSAMYTHSLNICDIFMNVK